MVAATGNTLGAPPRLSGDPQRDTLVLQRWIQSFYESVVLDGNVIGTQKQQTADLAAIEARLTAAETKLEAIGAITALAGPVAGTYTPQQLADAYDAINSIIVGAKAA